MRAAMPLATCLVLAASLSGCLGIDNMAQFKAALGFGPQPLEVEPPLARLRASPTLAAVGQPVAFSAQGSLDPLGGDLDFTWAFGDGASARGSEATHRYLAPGVYEATLTVTAPPGVAGSDAVLVTVVENRAPVAALVITRGGQPVERAVAGEDLAFVAEARDPEGGPLTVAWDFGDGRTALTPEARHAFARGGLYQVALRAEDASGLATTATRALPVDHRLAEAGEVALLRDDATHAVPVAAGALAMRVGVAFDALLGVNAITLRILDAAGEVVTEQTLEPPPAATGAFQGAVELAAQDFQGHAPGDWTIAVQRASGAQVPYDLTVEVQY